MPDSIMVVHVILKQMCIYGIGQMIKMTDMPVECKSIFKIFALTMLTCSAMNDSLLPCFFK